MSMRFEVRKNLYSLWLVVHAPGVRTDERTEFQFVEATEVLTLAEELRVRGELMLAEELTRIERAPRK
jgi:hypothetical protein